MSGRPAVDWVAIPAGPFTMGSDLSHDKFAYGNEMPQHEVDLAAFQMARFCTTNGDYARFVEATGHRPPRYWSEGRPPRGRDRHPVAGVDWFDARACAEWLGGRLPTEAEWEKAARGTDRRLYPWGQQQPTIKRCNQCLFVGDTTPVDRFPLGASAYGVMDMGGNVWEWTASKAGDYPYVAEDGREDPEWMGEFRVLRGGGFRTVNRVRCAFRDVGTRPDDADVFRGFRVARSR